MTLGNLKGSHRTRRLVVGLTAAGLVATGVTVATQASAASSGTVLKVAITSHGLYLDGPTTFPAGRVKVSLDAAGAERTTTVVRLHRGYSFQEFRQDVLTVGKELFGPNGNKKKGLAALNHAIKNVTFYGGLDVAEGQQRHGVLLLDRPSNRYVIFDDSGNAPKRAVHLTVTAPEGPQTLPATTKTVTAKADRRFGGDTVLPAAGNVTFWNKATYSPHLLYLQHVKEGTTRRQVINAFSGGSFDFVLPGFQGTPPVSPRHSMVLHTNLPKGEYAEMCFFIDPKTGELHAAMGMVRIVHLK